MRKLLLGFIVLIVGSLVLFGCSNKAESEKTEKNDESVKASDYHEILDIEITTELDEVLALLKEELQIAPKLTEEQSYRELEFERIELFNQPAIATMYFQDQDTFENLFPMYLLYEEEYDALRERFYEEEHDLNGVEEFNELPLTEQRKIDEKLVEYVSNSEVWSTLEQKYDAFSEKQTEPIQFETDIYLQGKFEFMDAFTQEDEEKLIDELTEVFGKQDETRSDPNVTIWNSKKTTAVLDCQSETTKDDTGTCTFLMLPNLSYMEEYTNQDLP